MQNQTLKQQLQNNSKIMTNDENDYTKYFKILEDICLEQAGRGNGSFSFDITSDVSDKETCGIPNELFYTVLQKFSMKYNIQLYALQTQPTYFMLTWMENMDQFIKDKLKNKSWIVFNSIGDSEFKTILVKTSETQNKKQNQNENENQNDDLKSFREQLCINVDKSRKKLFEIIEKLCIDKSKNGFTYLCFSGFHKMGSMDSLDNYIYNNHLSEEDLFSVVKLFAEEKNIDCFRGYMRNNNSGKKMNFTILSWNNMSSPHIFFENVLLTSLDTNALYLYSIEKIVSVKHISETNKEAK